MAEIAKDILQENIRKLEKAGVDSPKLSAELLLAHVLGLSRIDLVLEPLRAMQDGEVARFLSLCARREAGEPVAYLLGEKEFYGLLFNVTPDVLIPRPETEHVIEEVQAAYAPDAKFIFADLGTGSGILAVTLAKLFPNACGLAVDVSPAVLLVARRNAVRHGVERRLQFLHADFTCPLFAKASLDLCVSNPPYVSRGEYAEVSPEVSGYEPETALLSAENGMAHIRLMAPHVSEALKRGGRLFIEMGYSQGAAVLAVLSESGLGFAEQRVVRDLAGLDRVVAAVRG